MLYCPKGDLFNSFEQISQAQAITIFRQLLDAVEYLHSLGICHRDLKLENILMTEKGNIKLCDFGLASVSFDGNLSDACGSENYIAPEILNLSRFNGFKADMWGVGVILYILFAHKIPFPFGNGNPIDFANVPEEFIPVIQNLLSLEPQKRMSATEVKMFCKFSDVEIKELSVISSPTENQSQFVFGKLSQLTDTPIDTIRSILENPSPSLYKLLYILLKSKYDRNANSFERGQRHRSSPVAMNISKISETNQTFLAPSSSIVTRMKKFLVENKCCVSFPLSESPLIVLNGKFQDKRIIFSCEDDLKNGTCALSLVTDDQSLDIVRAIIDHLSSNFKIIDC